ncbi:MAG: hypothetical protein PHR60_03875 [Eubacteriales bacterium]|nr:hypothetical protein [Eubacteriales bacterium]MDD4583311.1 hypothetical protein [Eubacteriales bacterium]
MKLEFENKEGLMCSKCRLLLEPGKAHITYLKSTFPVELLTCPKCGEVYVPEDLALGKMQEVEKNLEDK